ncbi:MAG: hypothetical protein L3J68_01180 [Thermoplasmata archaeon]|nr:hypothetical protein [Thermoplasmata archaeon]
MGGGLGDIEEVLAAGRELARAGFRPLLFRLPGRALPRSVDGPWDWPPVERRDRLVPLAPAALTVSPAWGISAAPSRPEPFGRGGPWELEARAVEEAYGPASTLHVSLEEFARTLPSAEENRERLREGGVLRRALPARLARSQRAGEVDQFRTAFRTHRAFDRANVLHLFATFRADRQFAREYPAAVQTGPLWPRYRRSDARRAAKTAREWVWYASPPSAEAIAPGVVAGLSEARPRVRLYVRTGREWATTFPSDRVIVAVGPLSPRAWRRRFARAELRIVTGSRTLLEAMEHGGPFLYFNGVFGYGARRRRHRPEKLRAWLDVARAAGAAPGLRRDIADFSRGRRIRTVVRNAASGRGGWADFPRHLGPFGFSPPYDDAGHLIVAVARALAADPTAAPTIVASVRSGATAL